MSDVVLNTDDMVVVGGPAIIDLSLEVGATGQRGSKIYAGYGHPNDGLSGSITPLIGDLYINAQSTSEEYSFLYQYQAIPNGNPTSQWVHILKLQPTTYAKNDQVEFVDGTAEVIIAANNIVKLTETQSLSEANFNIQCNIINDSPVALSVSLVQYTTIGGILKLTFNINALEYNGTSWENLDGVKSAHILITVV